MYAKIINQETKQCEVGIGTNIAFYQKLGMTEMEVEQAYNGNWYLKGYAPEEPEEHKKESRKKELIAELDALDLKCIRALRAIQSGKSTDADTVILADYEKEAETIRKQLRNLED